MTISLSVDKTIVRGNEIVTFTVSGGRQGDGAILMQKGFTAFNDVEVGRSVFDSSGIARIQWKAATVQKYDFYVNSDCGFWCGEKTGLVSVSVTDAPCDPGDILCNAGGGIERTRKDAELLIAAALIIAIVLVFIFYFPKKRLG